MASIEGKVLSEIFQKFCFVLHALTHYCDSVVDMLQILNIMSTPIIKLRAHTFSHGSLDLLKYSLPCCP